VLQSAEALAQADVLEMTSPHGPLEEEPRGGKETLWDAKEEESSGQAGSASELVLACGFRLQWRLHTLE